MSLKTTLELKDVVGCSLSSSAREVADLMETNTVGAIVVMDGGRPVGMITDRDLVLRSLLLGERGLRRPAKDIMTRPIRTVPDSAGIYDVVDIMNEHGIRRVCVVDEEGKCAGLVSAGDVIELIAEEIFKLKAVVAPRTEKLVKKRVAA